MDPHLALLVSFCTFSVLISAMLLVAWHGFGRHSYILCWALAFGFLACQWMVCIFWEIGIFPSHEVFNLAFSGLTILFATLLLHGFRQRAELKSVTDWLVLMGAIIFALYSWSILSEPERVTRLLVPLYTSSLLFWTVAVVLLNQKEHRHVMLTRGTATITCLCAFQYLAISLIQGSSASIPLSDLYSNSIMTGVHVSLLCLGMFCLFLGASDAFEQLRAETTTDHLTGVLNLKGFEIESQRALSLSRRYQSDLSLIVANISHSNESDKEQHSVADDLSIKIFSEALKMSMRSEDSVCRTKEEEFALILPNTCLQEAMMTALRIRDTVESTMITCDERGINLTTSFGVTELHAEDNSLEDIMNRAREALLSAKKEGRNNVKAA